MRRALADLHHDVGKRIARTARNLRGLTLTPKMLELLVTDLYAIDGSARASAVFEERAQALGALPELEAIRRLLARIDALEAGLRAAEPPAISEATTLALEVSDTIAALLVREVGT